MAILFCFTACKNSSSDSGDDFVSGSDPSQNAPAEKNADGIYIKFAIPNKDVVRYEVFIEGIGQVSETGVGENKTEDDFFYPFVNKNTEYTVRINFLKNENQDDEGYTIETPDQVVDWFEVKATAGANSKGEVCLKDFGEIEVKDNGNFKFTKKPAFENESLLTGSSYDWVLGIGLSEGVSWEHPNRRSKWLTEIEVPNKDLLGKTHNFYTYPRPYGDVTKVDFIVYRPKMSYQYGGKEYKYQWGGKTVDTNCRPEAELWADINVTNSADVAKIQGTWTENGEWDDTESHYVNVHVVYNSVLVIDATTVENWSFTYTKLDGSAFTKEELLENEWAYSDSSENWKLRENCTLSNDGKMLTQKYGNTERPLSEYFADRKYNDGYTAHYDLKLFADSLLRIIQSGTESDGEDYEWYNEYKKQ